MAISLLLPVVSTISTLLALETTHQQHPAEADLEVLVGQAGRLAAEDTGQHLGHRRMGFFDCDHPEIDPEAIGQRLGITLGPLVE